MKKVIVSSLIFLSLLALFIRFGLNPLSKYLSLQSKAGIKITSIPQAEVEVNDLVVGKTPFLDDNLTEGEVKVKLNSSLGSWQGNIRLNKGTITVLNRELGVSQASSSGETLILYPGSGVIITSHPEGAAVWVDGKDSGTTPQNFNLAAGEHNFILGKVGYLKRSIRVNLPDNLSLHLDVDLSLTEVDLSNTSSKVVKETAVIVKETPLGFLRVRDRPSLQSLEIAKVQTGDKLIMLEDLKDWIKIKLGEKVGYVASEYIQKI